MPLYLACVHCLTLSSSHKDETKYTMPIMWSPQHCAGCVQQSSHIWVSGGITCYIRKQAAYETIEVKIVNSPSYTLAIVHALKYWEVVSHSSRVNMRLINFMSIIPKGKEKKLCRGKVRV